MQYIVINGVKPWDGRYEFDTSADFTTREWGWIKRLAGYMPLTVDQGFDGGDPELYAALAVIAMHRAGKIEPRQVPDIFDRLGDSPFGTTVSLEGDPEPDDEDDEGDADPPARSSSGSGNTSGPVTPLRSATSEPPSRPSGPPVSATSESRPTWSAS